MYMVLSVDSEVCGRMARQDIRRTLCFYLNDRDIIFIKTYSRWTTNGESFTKPQDFYFNE